jgi:hypothetical protein
MKSHMRGEQKLSVVVPFSLANPAKLLKIQAVFSFTRLAGWDTPLNPVPVGECVPTSRLKRYFDRTNSGVSV